jgi:hypothetical protein
MYVTTTGLMARHFPILTTTTNRLDQCNNSFIDSALLDLVHSNISDLSASISSSPVVTPDKYHPPLLDFNLTLDSLRVSLTPHCSYAQSDYLLLLNVLHHSGWFCVLNENSIDSAVKISLPLCVKL